MPKLPMPRLFFRFYAALLASLALLTVAVGLLWHYAGEPIELPERTLGTVLRNALPPAEAPAEQQQAALARLTRGLRADITLFSRDWERLAFVGEPLERPDRRQLRMQRDEWRERMERIRAERRAARGAQEGGPGEAEDSSQADGNGEPALRPYRRPAERAGETGVPRADDPAAAGERTGRRMGERSANDTEGGNAAGPLARAGQWARSDAEREQALRNRRFQMRLEDGRHIVSSTPLRQQAPSRNRLHIMLIGLALIVAIGAYPVVRRVTRRLEHLQAGVESLGAGNLAARVKVEGSDEVAALAASFNRSADQIETLVNAHKSLLANASHELRTPLARIRLALELSTDKVEAKRRAGLEQDIAELDQLIDEILLASRLDAVGEKTENEEVDLLALAAEECARYEEADLDGESLAVRGDARLLRRMLRNLLENARRHGVPPTTVKLRRNGGGMAEIVVQDAGPGVKPAEYDKVFEPFYRSSNARDSVGSGLGLALVRQIAQRHGGDARCANIHNGRSAFVITLPLA